VDELQRLRDLAISDTGFVFDPYTGPPFSVNETGVALLRGLKGGLGRDELVELVGETFEVGEEDIGRDLDEFVQLLRENGLLPLTYVVE